MAGTYYATGTLNKNNEKTATATATLNKNNKTTGTGTNAASTNTKVKSASDYNPYDDIQKVYNAKVAWNNATTDAEKKKQNEIANAARATLKAYGYEDVVNQISASGADATATRAILEKYAPPLSNTELITKNDNEVNQKVNQLWGLQTDDHSDLTDMYKKEYESIKNTNPFTTAEAKAILAKYDLAGLQGRDNAVASGSASNGGNIDSYSAANAMRQQASLTNQGQMAVLDAHQQKIENARSILEGLGAYQKDSYKGMQDTIGIQQTEGQRLFENEETAKNNATDRLYKESEVTGNVPLAWVIKNDSIYSQYLNEDGSFKKEMEGVDIQSLINAAKARGDNDAVEKLSAVRSAKINGNMDEFGKYVNQGDLGYIKNRNTADVNQFNASNATENKSIDANLTLGLDTNAKSLEGTKYTTDASERIALDTNETELESVKDTNQKSYDATVHTNNSNVTMTDSTNASAERINDANNKNALDQITTAGEEERKTTEHTSTLNQPFTWTTDSVKKMNDIVKSINSNAKESHKDLYENGNLISESTNGATWQLNLKNGMPKSSWAWTIYDAVVNNPGVTEDEAAAFLTQLGYTWDDFAGYISNPSGKSASVKTKMTEDTKN